MLNVTYIFGDGRLNKLEKSHEYAKEFFYGFQQIKKNKKFNTQIVELLPFTRPEKGVLWFIKKIDTFLNKVTFLQFHYHEIFKKYNYKKIIKSDVLVFSNDRLAFCFFPILKFKKNLNSIVFVMGLLKTHKNLKFYQKYIRPYLISYFIKSVDQFIFLGKPEYELAVKRYPKSKEKFNFIPFSIDYDFWHEPSKISKKNQSSKEILFIGNDGNRNYEFLKKLPEKLSEFNFTFISEQIKKVPNIENIKLISGNWSTGYLTDKELKNYYKDSFLTILPIKNTLQPSGQSVTLQSMSVGTPVLISNFDGFWDYEVFFNNDNIFFIDNFDYKDWVKKITEIYNNQDLLNDVAKSGNLLIKEKYNLDDFINKLSQIIDTFK
tara:strand:+ start:1997 stop:3127 length:1131 start_codon:yes stop_codon:yes gene_type:complete